MKVAILSDIHSNLEALNACLSHARSQGAEQYVFLGDLVGYGADPVACLDIIQEHASRGAVVLLGNHDEAAISDRYKKIEVINFVARDAIYWTRSQLRDDQRAFLQGLPLTVQAEEGNALYVHASANEPSRWHYVTGSRDAVRSMVATEAAYTFVGHVHHPLLYFRRASQDVARAFHPTPGMPIPMRLTRQWLAIVGSVGQPRDGNNAAAYVMMDYANGALTFHRVPYDYMTTARKIIAAGLPERLAHRLEHGR